MLAAGRLLQRLSGKPEKSNAHRRSRSADPPRSVKDKFFVEHLHQLRQEIEEKTESLNDSSFEVTETWLLEFAGQHAEYMEKATSRAGANCEFRSTTDLFQHVLQHPSVQKYMAGWQPAPARTSKASASCLSPEATGSPGSTETPGSTEGDAEDLAEETTSPKSRLLPISATDADDTSASTPTQSTVMQALEPLTEAAVPQDLDGMPSVEGSKAASNQPIAFKPAIVPHHRALLPAPALHPPREDGELTQKMRQRANSTSRVSRMSWPASDVRLAGEDGELMRKMQQRATATSWQGLGSPRSRRLAAAAEADQFKGADEIKTDKLALAARRKSLESKLASCGFQRAAPLGGA